jgi:23S rRNA (uracil1939-C5)-methyltransferase
MRARFHVHGARVGFYREGTHQLCDAAATHQLRRESMHSVTELMAALAPAVDVTSIAIAENSAGDQRAAHLELAARYDKDVIEQAAGAAGLRGLSARNPATGDLVTAGEPIVVEPLRALTDGRVSGGVVQRRAESFFQGNRFLLPQLVAAVADVVPDVGEVLDLYAGVGLFSIALAAMGRLEVTAVEGDHAGGADLRENARAQEPRVKVHVESVERFLTRRSAAAATVIVDPPRTGLSAEALTLLLELSPERLVYVSCDPPTLARDARRLFDAGYALTSLRAFDFFPNTPHVESLALFTRAGRGDQRVK